MLHLLIAACGGSGSGSGNGNGDALGDMDGTWEGTWVSGEVSGRNGSFEAQVVQSGSSLSGSIDIPYIGMENAVLTGTVSGSRITFGDIDHTITFVGSVSGDRCSGTFSMPAYDERGTWTADRTAEGGDSATGGLDLHFGEGGVLVSDLHLTPAAIAVQSTGRILIAGDPMSDFSIDVVQIVALTNGGQLDTAFGGGAVVTTTATPAGADRVCGMSLAEDDTIYLCTQAGEDNLVLLSYTASGEPDTNFGNGGQVSVALDAGETISAMTRSADGRLLVAGMTSGRLIVRRFLSDGSLDTTFGVDGATQVSVTDLQRVADLTVNGSGHILIGGSAGNDFLLLCLTESGVVDTDFASGGITSVDVDSDDEAHDLALLSDGRILLAGFGQIDFWLPKTAVIAAFNTDGSLADSFGTQGICGVSGLENDVAPLFGSFLQVGVDTYDRIAIGGMDANLFLVARFSSDGQIDNSFGGDGFETADFSSTGGWDFATAVTIQNDDKIVAAGVAASCELVVVRYSP
jgi:uncharacterized delta-60 repeat protein